MSTAADNNEQYSGGGEDTADTKEFTSCEHNNVDDITKGIDSIDVLDDVSTCANCGKVGNSDDMNICNRCQMVKYCNAACKKKHRTKHKKKCDRRVAEIYDEKLFKEVEPEECPICLLPIPINGGETTVSKCCGKRICLGCMYAMKMSEGKDVCAFCRTPPASSNKEGVNRLKKLMESNNAEAYHLLAGAYDKGEMGLPQDRRKANELNLKAGELGCATGYYNLGNSYAGGHDYLDVDMKKAQYYWELAAMNGDVYARHNLGKVEGQAGNYHQALKHFIIAAAAGLEKSLDCVKKGFISGMITKDEYADILRAYQVRGDEMKSNEREEAAKALAAMRRRRGFRS